MGVKGRGACYPVQPKQTNAKPSWNGSGTNPNCGLITILPVSSMNPQFCDDVDGPQLYEQAGARPSAKSPLDSYSDRSVTLPEVSTYAVRPSSSTAAKPPEKPVAPFREVRGMTTCPVVSMKPWLVAAKPFANEPAQKKRGAIAKRPAWSM